MDSNLKENEIHPRIRYETQVSIKYECKRDIYTNIFVYFQIYTALYNLPSVLPFLGSMGGYVLPKWKCGLRSRKTWDTESMRCKCNIGDKWRDSPGWREYHICGVLREARPDCKSSETFGEEFFKEMKLRETWMWINTLKRDLNNWWMDLGLN